MRLCLRMSSHHDYGLHSSSSHHHLSVSSSGCDRLHCKRGLAASPFPPCCAHTRPHHVGVALRAVSSRSLSPSSLPCSSSCSAHTTLLHSPEQKQARSTG